ncbi:hypothetical protein EDD22DRAFT_145545 [Suillus occidentalis]|nr:hypothetical protein EDD22DRAFT_145545 [Suillus occidentalis]
MSDRQRHSKINCMNLKSMATAPLHSGSMASLMTGLSISSIVFLILTAQVWIYFSRHTIRSRENWHSKLLVAIIWLMQAAQIGITSRIASIQVHRMDFEDFAQFISRISTSVSHVTHRCSF